MAAAISLSNLVSIAESRSVDDAWETVNLAVNMHLGKDGIKKDEKKPRLLPLVVLAFQDFITFIGQEAPKLTIIIISRISAIIKTPFAVFRYDTTLFAYCKELNII